MHAWWVVRGIHGLTVGLRRAWLRFNAPIPETGVDTDPGAPMAGASLTFELLDGIVTRDKRALYCTCMPAGRRSVFFHPAPPPSLLTTKRACFLSVLFQRRLTGASQTATKKKRVQKVGPGETPLSQRRTVTVQMK